jgi:imidazolonepropionase-like amidohydrolase
LPPELQRNFKSGGALEVPDGQEAVYAASFQKLLEMTKLLHDNGITIVPGTDDVAGFVLHKELENYSKAGIPNADVLKIATLQSAKVAGKEKEFGSLEPGKVADIIIINGDPLRQMSDIRRVQTIIKGQEIYESSALYKAISIEPLK